MKAFQKITFVLFFLSVIEKVSFSQSSESSLKRMQETIGKEDLVICSNHKEDALVYQNASLQLSKILTVQYKEICLLIEAVSYNMLSEKDKHIVLSQLAKLRIDDFGTNTATSKVEYLKRKGIKNAEGIKMQTDAVRKGLVK